MGAQFYNCGHAHKTQGNGKGKLQTVYENVKYFQHNKIGKRFAKWSKKAFYKCQFIYESEETFRTHWSVRQGSVTLPQLFILFMNRIIR